MSADLAQIIHALAKAMDRRGRLATHRAKHLRRIHREQTPEQHWLNLQAELDGTEACRDNPDGWFDPKYRQDAAAICRHCHVADLCYLAGLSLPPLQRVGVWGGVDLEEKP